MTVSVFLCIGEHDLLIWLLTDSGHASCFVKWGRKMRVVGDNLPPLKLRSASLSACPWRVLMAAAAPEL